MSSENGDIDDHEEGRLPSEGSSEADSVVRHPKWRPHHEIPKDDPAFDGLSKRSQKRLLKQRRFEATKDEKRAIEKEKRKLKKRERHEAIVAGLAQPPPKRAKPEEQTPCRVRIAIDCAFDDLMMDKEIKSMLQQITRCHSQNRLTQHPIPFTVTSQDKNTSKIAQGFKSRHDDHSRWAHVKWETRPIEQIFDKDELIYLSADATDVCETLDESKVYVIGGIVDHNRHKLLCENKAKTLGIKSAQLPIGDYIKLNSRKVLTVNHVFEILLRYTETHDWQKAFLAAIPQRKIENGQETEAGLYEQQEEDGGQTGDDLVSPGHEAELSEP
ncbi:hypothetical protein BZG36_02412 [Bifiguratus adelaidae]|uniref:tRNA (guanine(9)-N1)-methyltransferase n=1 Tax=Bifiguratus adelaidae TaxID=1938954 RepID=A0A261Y1D1_9FUNG|nr:hypothetical protein BZG36_02412 [Bifiguratus adelaidae]